MEEIINIPDAYQDPRFNQEVDKKTGLLHASQCSMHFCRLKLSCNSLTPRFKTHSILAIPMTDGSGHTRPRAAIEHPSFTT
eukprot:6464833-Amphidinium_carterae.1